MPIIDTKDLAPGEPRPGWHDRHFSGDTMSFAYYEVDAGSRIHEHSHPEEEVWHVIEGELEFTLEGEAHRLGPGMAAVVPSDASHSVRALTAGRVIVANHPARKRIRRHD